MAQTKYGARLVAAQKIGISLLAYDTMVSCDFKWCYKCREWVLISNFGIDNSRYDKLSSKCKNCTKQTYKDSYVSKPKTFSNGRKFVKSRSGDKKQARRRINYLVESNLIPNPNDLPCVDCNHAFDNKKRHEYDHYLGYGEQNHETVEVVCSSCHHRRHPQNG